MNENANPRDVCLMWQTSAAPGAPIQFSQYADKTFQPCDLIGPVAGPKPFQMGEMAASLATIADPRSCMQPFQSRTGFPNQRGMPVMNAFAHHHEMVQSISQQERLHLGMVDSTAGAEHRNNLVFRATNNPTVLPYSGLGITTNGQEPPHQAALDANMYTGVGRDENGRAEELFETFYMATAEERRLTAARALYRLGWVFHLERQIWLKREGKAFEGTKSHEVNTFTQMTCIDDDGYIRVIYKHLVFLRLEYQHVAYFL